MSSPAVLPTGADVSKNASNPVLALKEADLKMMLAAKVHLGTKNADAGAHRYIWRRRPDGVHIINLGKTSERNTHTQQPRRMRNAAARRRRRPAAHGACRTWRQFQRQPTASVTAGCAESMMTAGGVWRSVAECGGHRGAAACDAAHSRRCLLRPR